MITGVKLKLPGAAVLVVDDGSTDYTAKEAREAGADAATLPFNAGLGTALQTGYRYTWPSSCAVGRPNGHSGCPPHSTDLRPVRPSAAVIWTFVRVDAPPARVRPSINCG